MAVTAINPVQLGYNALYSVLDKIVLKCRLMRRAWKSIVGK